MILKIYISIFVFLFIHSVGTALPYIPTLSTNFTQEEEIIKARLLAMDCLVSIKYTPSVSSYVDQYIFRQKSSTQKLLGKAAFFFPIFEKFLKNSKLPQELKAMAIMESWLDPDAVSRSGAIGLWQFMPGTAKDCGLLFNAVVDERRDPCKSTIAAAKYLEYLYNQYHDWALTLAAYNGGPQRVNNAIAMSGGNRNFWEILHLLPVETQNYVPKYIAINYLLNYYNEHDIHPEFQELDFQLTEFVVTEKKVDFRKFAKSLGIPTQTLILLNPAYKKLQIPSNPNGNYIILPKRFVKKAESLLLSTDDERLLDAFSEDAFIEPSIVEDQPYIELIYTVGLQENLTTIAQKYNIEPSQIMLWNRMTSDYVVDGQEIKLNVPIEKFKRLEFMGDMPSILVSQIDYPLKKTTPEKPSYNLCGFTSNTNITIAKHIVAPFENIQDILNLYPGNSINDICRLNEIEISSAILEGQILLVKKEKK